MDKAKLLLIFTAVIRAGAMSRAAPALGMTASAISQHIRRLEALYGLKLLNRNTRRLELTEAGQVLWQQAERLSQLMQDTDAAICASCRRAMCAFRCLLVLSRRPSSVAC